MKSATISEAKNRLSELLLRVKRGESVLIFEREVPIARIDPVEKSGAGADARLAELERAGVLRRPARKPTADMLRTLPPMPQPKASALAELLAERDQGR